MKKIFVFACMLLTPALGYADIAYPGRKYEPRRHTDVIISATNTDMRDIMFLLMLLGALAGVAEGVHLCWKAYKNAAARAAYLFHAAAYGVLGVAMAILPYALMRVPTTGLPIILSAIGLFWFLRRIAKRKMPK